MMTSANCPDCNLELNEQHECAQCGFAAAASFIEQIEATAESEFSFPSVPIAPSDVAELDAVAAAAASEDEVQEFPAEDDVDSGARQESAEDDDSSLEDADEGWRDAESPDDATQAEENGAAGEDALLPLGGVRFGTRLKKKATVKGNVNNNALFIGEYIVNPLAPKGTEPKDDDERTLIDFTETLPQKNPRLPEFVSEELSEYLEKLKDERLVLISCPDEDIAFSAAHALIDGLNLPQAEQRRLLNVDRSAGEGLPLSVYYLRGKSDHGKETLVLVDATTEKAGQFLEPITQATLLSSAAIQDDLRRNDMYMLCLVNPAHVEDRQKSVDGGTRPTSELKFPCWRIPFLRRLLERYFEQPEEVEKKIEQQRANGWWGLSDRDFYFELKSYLLRDELPAEIVRRAEAPPPGPVKELFKGDEPLSDTVLYVATFFPNLTPHEFNRTVSMLLDGPSPAVSHGKAKEAKDSARKVADVSGENDPLLVWRKFPDQVLDKCSLVTIPFRDATKGVNFSNHNLRDKLREHLEREYSFFLENRFQDVQELGLIFSPSSNISRSAAQLSVEMAAAYPEYYGSKWLAAMVADFEASFANGDDAAAPAWRFTEEDNAGRARKQFYQSLSELVRAMLDEPRLKNVVEDFLQQLLLSKHYGGVLEIIKRLQFAPAFDQFQWLKQLLHRGAQQIRAQTNEYLRGYLKRMGGRVYQVLSSLESWLPKEDRSLQTYPIPARYALRLLHFYFSEAVFGFDARYFGSWPSISPLFAYRDADTAMSNLRLLVKLLFHPGMEGVFKELRINGVLFINRLLTGCFFILQGKDNESVRSGVNVADGAAPQFDAATVSNLLLNEIARAVNAQRQSALLAYWREESERMLRVLRNKPYGSTEWEEIAWKRDLIIELITRHERLRGSAFSLP
jgi:hypothetical protein